jgi:hypothetical protein
VLQHQTGGVRTGPPVLHLVAVMQQGPRVVQRGDQPTEQLPAGRALLRAAGTAAPQMQRAELEQGVQLLLGQRHPPVIALKVKRNRPGGLVNPGLGELRCDRVHARSPVVVVSGSAAVSIATRWACRWASERFSWVDSSRPDRWM